MWLFSSRQKVETAMKRRELVARTVLLAAILILAPVVTGTPVNNGFRLINQASLLNVVTRHQYATESVKINADGIFSYTASMEVSYSPEGSSHESDVDVQDLHSLHIKDIDKTATNFSDDANHDVSHSTADDKKRSLNDKSDSVLSDFTFNSDTPHDMAEYIFWTGDENSVINAVSDFVNQGLITVEEGKEFMGQVQHDLNEIRFRYGTNTDRTTPEVPSENTREILKEAEEDNESHQLSELIEPTSKPEPAEGHKSHKGEIVVTSYRQESKSSSEPKEETSRLEDEIKTRGTLPSNIKEEHLNEAHIVDLLSNQYTLEEILYQLARILFSQSLSQAGQPEAEEALRKFADFLEKESKEGKMSPELQKKVLDVMLMSLFDSMADQHIPSSPPVTSSPTQRLANDKH